MYHQTYTRIECSKCGSGLYEDVQRNLSIMQGGYGYETYRRCRQCGHEKLLHTLSTRSSSEQIVYNMKLKDKEVF